MEDSKKKRTFFVSLMAILLLIGVTVLTSYAFFTYYRSGQKNQLLLTGRIKLVFEDGVNNINLTNQFPLTDAEAMTLPFENGDVAVTNFTVSGYAGGSIVLQYSVYALKGSVETGKTRISDDHIKIYLTETHDRGDVLIENDFDYHSGNNYGALASAGRETDTNVGGEILLAVGEVATENSTHNYTMRMWISDNVTISDTDTTKTYCASAVGCQGNRTIFSNLYYSLKIRVENINME